MPVAAANQRAKFADGGGIAFERPALPEYPRIPDEIKNSNPKLRAAWEKYDEDLAEFFRRQHQRNI